MNVPSELVGCEVRRTSFDYQVRLALVDQPDPADEPRVDAELVLETSFVLRDVEGVSHELEPGSGAALAPVLALFGQRVTEVAVPEEGTLTVVFDGGAELRVGPDRQYESWWLTGHGVEPILVGPDA
ncbi:DUF6188 family protein [Amycolatopsis sp. NPDC001319]|uniref:DUF6188 family protein n=1 Tax=unclassified Amycolatopsis TaxID=2618356 RepID=UPI0036C87C7C